MSVLTCASGEDAVHYVQRAPRPVESAHFAGLPGPIADDVNDRDPEGLRKFEVGCKQFFQVAGQQWRRMDGLHFFKPSLVAVMKCGLGLLDLCSRAKCILAPKGCRATNSNAQTLKVEMDSQIAGISFGA